MKIRIILLLILIIGIGLFVYSLTLPYYKDKKAADDLLNRSYDIEKSEYYKLEAELRTNKTTFMDLGSGIAIASGAVLLFLTLTRINTFSDFKNIKTPNKRTVFISSNIVWLILIPGTFWYYIFRGERGDYPPFADSIGIPLMTQIPFLLLLLIPLNLFIILTTKNTNLPTKLFIRADNYTKTKRIWEVFFIFWLTLNTLCLIGFVIDGDHFSILVNLFFTYILLTLRAGQISKQTTNEE